MTEVEKKGIGKAKIGLSVSIVLLVISLISNAWLYTQMRSLNSSYNSYKTSHGYSNSEYNSLQFDYESLNSSYYSYIANHSYTNSEYNSLQSEYNNYKSMHHYTDSEYHELEDEIDSLKAPQLHYVNYEEEIHFVWLDTDYVTVKGTLFNSGTYRAKNVVLTIRVYDSEGALLETEQISFGNIYGKSYQNFDERIDAEGAYYVATQLTYN